MTKQVYSPELDGPIDLRDPWLAAFLAWLVPGLGHLYQRRTGKGLLLMIVILSTFFYGLFALGDGRVVYASWSPQPRRPHYLPQLAVGLPALPALVEGMRARSHKKFLFGGVMAPPAFEPPRNGVNLDNPTESELHKDLNRYFELGTVFTMIAGLLNVLAIFDAWGGPAYFDDRQAGRKTGPPGDGDDRGPPPPGPKPPEAIT